MIYLITSSDFTNRALLSSFVDSEKLNISIWNAQETFVRPLLGDTLYDDILTKHDAGTLNAAETALYNKIVPYLVHRSYISYVSMSGIMDTQSGLRKNIDDFSEQLNGDEFAAVLRLHKTMAEVSYNDLYAHLEENKASFPAWQDSYCAPKDKVENFSAIGANRRQRGKYDGDRTAKDNRKSSRQYNYDRKTRRYY